MANLVTENAIPGLTVYGVQQMQYTVDGLSGQDFAAALTIAAFRQSTAIENSASSYGAVVRQRQKKVDELGEVLACLARANAKFDSSPKTGDKVTVDNASWVKDICDTYEVDISWDGNKITYGNMQKATTNVQYAIDREDNDLEQDMVTMQSYISKRDNAFSNASKVVKKTLNAGSTTIGNMGS